mgnify:FL=1
MQVRVGFSKKKTIMTGGIEVPLSMKHLNDSQMCLKVVLESLGVGGSCVR